jgi:hypothetical protein
MLSNRWNLCAADDINETEEHQFANPVTSTLEAPVPLATVVYGPALRRMSSELD